MSAAVSVLWAFETLISTAFVLAIELANHGILVRGGITKGELYHRDAIAFGPAFIRAYRLEQAAGSPRVVLDSGVAENALWPEEMDDVLKRSIPKDFDGWRYVDYFSSHRVGEFDDGPEGLERHYTSLRAMVREHESSKDPSLRSKYGWVASKLQAVHR